MQILDLGKNGCRIDTKAYNTVVLKNRIWQGEKVDCPSASRPVGRTLYF
jgi:hypothetical protein